MKKCLLAASLLVSICTQANVKLPKLVANNMVLQRNAPVRVWGWADKDEAVTVTFNNKQFKAIPKGDKWEVVLPSMKEGGPYDIVVKGNNEITIKNVLIGDVWLCSGQSNMGYLMMNTSNAKDELPKANYPNIRLFSIKKDESSQPLQDPADYTSWVSVTPETVQKFSAVGYLFGKKLHEDLQVPIGLIFSAYGGTTIESWISPEGLVGEETFGEKAQLIATRDLKEEQKRNEQKFDEWIKKINTTEAGYDNGNYGWAKEYHTDWKTTTVPMMWEKTTDFKDMDGVVWYQKEITLTAADIAANATLNLGAITDEDRTFINGVAVGNMSDAKGKKRVYNIDKSVLKEGVNFITVRITNYRDDGGFGGKAPELTLNTAANKITLSGEWKYKIGLDSKVPTGVSRQINTRQIPCILYNAMIAPVTPYTIKGVLWYQGESNAPRGYQYKDLFARMITDWRKKFGNNKLPFVYAQLPNYKKIPSNPVDAEWAETREAQAAALKLPYTAMACTIDQGEANDIHPKYKNEVGRRLGLQAEYAIYGFKDSIPSGPVYKSMKVVDGKVLVEFDVVGTRGLLAKDSINEIKGFSIAGEEGKFVWAKASITNKNTVTVYADAIKKPVAVRYAWADNPGELNLTNNTKMPAYPFRTDSFKGMTQDIKFIGKE